MVNPDPKFVILKTKRRPQRLEADFFDPMLSPKLATNSLKIKFSGGYTYGLGMMVTIPTPKLHPSIQFLDMKKIQAGGGVVYKTDSMQFKILKVS